MTATARVPTDIAIAQAAKLRPVADIAAELGLEDDELELYGKYKAKVRLSALARRKPRGRLVLVTGINPTPAGEGKSTVTVGVTQALRKLGKNAARHAKGGTPDPARNPYSDEAIEARYHTTVIALMELERRRMVPGAPPEELSLEGLT